MRTHDSDSPVISAIEAGLLIDGTDRQPVANATVVVEDGRIAEVRRDRRPIRGARVLDYGQQVVMPGLIDSHAHLELPAGSDHETGIRTHEAEQRAGITQMRALENAQRALIGGVTTLQDCGSTVGLMAVRDAIAAGLPGPRLRVAGPPITTTAGHGHWLNVRSDTEAEVRKTTRWLIEQGVDVIKVVASGGNATAGSNPLQPQYSESELAAAVTEAHRLGRRVVAHALNAESIRRCFAAGVDVIDHCYWQQADGSTSYDVTLAGAMAASDVTVGLTGSGILRILLDRGEDGASELRERLASHRQMFDAGIRMTVHSDAGARFTRFERFFESLQVMVVGLQVAPQAAIRAATRFAAESMGLGADIGTIEASKRADLLVIDRNPLDDIDNIRSIYHVIRDGRVIVDQGKLCPPWGLANVNEA